MVWFKQRQVMLNIDTSLFQSRHKTDFHLVNIPDERCAEAKQTIILYRLDVFPKCIGVSIPLPTYVTYEEVEFWLVTEDDIWSVWHLIKSNHYAFYKSLSLTGNAIGEFSLLSFHQLTIQSCWYHWPIMTNPIDFCVVKPILDRYSIFSQLIDTRSQRDWVRSSRFFPSPSKNSHHLAFSKMDSFGIIILMLKTCLYKYSIPPNETVSFYDIYCQR